MAAGRGGGVATRGRGVAVWGRGVGARAGTKAIGQVSRLQLRE